jgi:hypothetical protein
MVRRLQRRSTLGRRRPRAKREMPIASRGIVPLTLMFAELLAQHDALVVTLIEHGVLDGEELDSSPYTEALLPGARQRIVQAFKSSLEDDDARHLLSLLSRSQYREGW